MSEENILQTPVHHNTECHDRDRHKSKLSEMHQVRKGESEVKLPFYKEYEFLCGSKGYDAAGYISVKALSRKAAERKIRKLKPYFDYYRLSVR